MKKKLVKLAACVLLVRFRADGTREVLLTRRSATLRSFPRAWVLPGGHVDLEDGSFEAAALRELREETGIAIDLGINDQKVEGQLVPLMIWESSFGCDER